MFAGGETVGGVGTGLDGEVPGGGLGAGLVPAGVVAGVSTTAGCEPESAVVVADDGAVVVGRGGIGVCFVPPAGA